MDNIYKNALESKLLGLIGHAEMEKEIQRTVQKIARDKDKIEIERKYIDLHLSKF